MVKKSLIGMHVLQVISDGSWGGEGEEFDYLMEMEDLGRNVSQWKEINKKYNSKKKDLEK